MKFKPEREDDADKDSTVNSVLESMVYMLRCFKYLTREEARDLFEEANGHSEKTSRLNMTYFIHTLVDTIKTNKETK